MRGAGGGGCWGVGDDRRWVSLTSACAVGHRRGNNVHWHRNNVQGHINNVQGHINNVQGHRNNVHRHRNNLYKGI